MKEQPMSDEKPMGQVIQIDEARIRDHLGEMVRGTVEETLNAIWMPKQTSSAVRAVTNAARRGRTPGLAVTIGRCRPAPGKLISRSRSYGDRRSRRPSLNVIAGGRARSRSP